MHYFLWIALTLVACTQAKEREVAKESAAAAVRSEQCAHPPCTEAAPATTITLAKPPASEAERTPKARPTQVEGTAKTAALQAEAPIPAPANDSPPSCKAFECPKGTRCELVEVQCIQAPCPPMPECRPEPAK